MLFTPSDLALYNNTFCSISSSTYVDPDGTCRIYYGALSELSPEDIFNRFNKITEIRNVEFYYHLQPDNIPDRSAYPVLPSMFDFKRTCPIWHFVDAANEGPKPTCNIIITIHGTGELPHDYDAMLNPLLCLMKSLTIAGFEHVAVKVVPAIQYDGTKCPVPSEMSMKLLRHGLEELMGLAKVTFDGDECRMKFHPRHQAETWSKQPRGGEATRAKSRAVLLRHQRRAKRGLRNLMKI